MRAHSFSPFEYRTQFVKTGGYDYVDAVKRRFFYMQKELEYQLEEYNDNVISLDLMKENIKIESDHSTQSITFEV